MRRKRLEGRVDGGYATASLQLSLFFSEEDEYIDMIS